MLDPEIIVKERMLTIDAFSEWLGIEVVHIAKGECETTMTITNQMVNGFGVTHGGIVYSLADSTVAFAANSFGTHAYTFETSISHLHKSQIGDILTAKATLRKRGYKISVLEVVVKNGDHLIALFKGTVYHDKEEWK